MGQGKDVCPSGPDDRVGITVPRSILGLIRFRCTETYPESLQKRYHLKIMSIAIVFHNINGLREP